MEPRKLQRRKKPDSEKRVRLSITLHPKTVEKLDRITRNRSKWIEEQIRQAEG